MQVKISIKDEEIIKHLEKLSPKKFIHGWADEIVTLAIENAKKKKQEVNGRSFWQREVIGSVHSTEHENHAVAYSDGVDTKMVEEVNYIKNYILSSKPPENSTVVSPRSLLITIFLYFINPPSAPLSDYRFGTIFGIIPHLSLFLLQIGNIF